MILILFFIGFMGKIYKIEAFRVIPIIYFFIGNFIYWILFKKRNKKNIIITKSTKGCENRLYYFSSITNLMLGFIIIRVFFKMNINVYLIIVFIITIILVYRNKEKEGPFSTNYQKGKIIEYEYYEDDDFFLEKKELESYKLCFENGSKKLEGPCKAYYKNGNLFIKYTYVNGVMEGEAKQYYENRQLKKEGFYKNGKLEGIYKEYYDDGKLYKEAIFKNGGIEGESKTYYKNGELQSVLFFKNDELDGESKTYYDNGQLEEIYFSKNGIENGIYKEYYKNGQLKIEGRYENGELEGSWKEYCENGELKKETFYNNEKSKKK